MDDIYKKVAQGIEKKGDHYDLLQEEYPDLSSDEAINIFNEEQEEKKDNEPFMFTILTITIMGLLGILFVFIDLTFK